MIVATAACRRLWCWYWSREQAPAVPQVQSSRSRGAVMHEEEGDGGDGGDCDATAADAAAACC